MSAIWIFVLITTLPGGCCGLWYRQLCGLWVERICGISLWWNNLSDAYCFFYQTLRINIYTQLYYLQRYFNCKQLSVSVSLSLWSPSTWRGWVDLEIVVDSITLGWLLVDTAMRLGPIAHTHAYRHIHILYMYSYIAHMNR